jgi:hypothetical protein
VGLTPPSSSIRGVTRISFDENGRVNELEIDQFDDATVSCAAPLLRALKQPELSGTRFAIPVVFTPETAHRQRDR